MNHILDLSSRAMRLSVENGLLRMESGSDAPVTVPLKEVAALVLGNPQITCTQPLLGGLAAAGAILIVCDERYMPVAMSLPLTGYHAPARRFLAQAAAPKPLYKRIWQQLVRAKIRAQARLLLELHGQDLGLMVMAKRVRSGDPDNLEGQAARLYWPALFDDMRFHRRTDAPDQNRFLNYGYAVLRAIVTRAICAAGLHPGLGVHHHHRDNPFCLADDLMEPLRPAVDRHVYAMTRELGPDAPMSPETKRRILGMTEDRHVLDGEQRSLFDIAAITASSLAQVFEGTRREVVIADA